MVHEYHPAPAPDDAFEPGTFESLVPGNAARMLDPRRTPVRVLAVRPEIGAFSCEVLAFEDRGAIWSLALERVVAFQFARGGARADAAGVRACEDAAARFAETIELPANPVRAARTAADLALLRGEAAAWLGSRSRFFGEGGVHDFGSREGDARLAADLGAYLGAHGAGGLERAFARVYVSHPESGEMVKAHRMALAALGLASYRGGRLRDPTATAGASSMAAREAHIVRRMGFVHAVFHRLGVREARLYRGVAGERLDPARRAPGFLSASFAREVAESMLGPPAPERLGRIEARDVPVERLSYVETAAMNHPFREAEAVMIVNESFQPFPV